MKTAIQATTDLYKYLKGKISADKSAKSYLTNLEVFKDEDKPASYKGSYLAVNALPFVYGSSIPNSDNSLNLNVHVPDLASGGADRIALAELQDYLLTFIPFEDRVEDTDDLFVSGAYYSVRSLTRPMADEDGTHFVNFKLKIIF